MSAFRTVSVAMALHSGVARASFSVRGAAIARHLRSGARPVPPPIAPTNVTASAQIFKRHPACPSPLSPVSRNTRLRCRTAHTDAPTDKVERVQGKKPPAQRGSQHRPDAPTSPFAELEIAQVSEKVGGVRVRQHANPLRREYQVPAQPLDWDTVYAEPGRPLALDIGAGYGRFLLMLHRHMGDSHNYLGVELRQPIVKRANMWAEELEQQRHVRFMNANGTISLGRVLETYPGELDLVTIQFPDPHFKKRHHKRRIVQQQLVEAISHRLRPGGRVFLQSDVEEVATAMRDQFERHAGDVFKLAEDHVGGECFSCSSPTEEDRECDEEGGSVWESTWAAHGWMATNPLGVPTEREVYVTQDKLPVYRVLLRKRE